MYSSCVLPVIQEKRGTEPEVWNSHVKWQYEASDAQPDHLFQRWKNLELKLSNWIHPKNLHLLSPSAFTSIREMSPPSGRLAALHTHGWFAHSHGRQCRCADIKNNTGCSQDSMQPIKMHFSILTPTQNTKVRRALSKCLVRRCTLLDTWWRLTTGTHPEHSRPSIQSRWRKGLGLSVGRIFPVLETLNKACISLSERRRQVKLERGVF